MIPRHAALLAAVLALVGAVPAGVAHASDVLTVYVSPTGDDTRDGTSPQAAVASLGRAQEVLDQVRGDADALVCLAGGSYTVANARWWHHRPGRDTTIRGSCWQPEDAPETPEEPGGRAPEEPGGEGPEEPGGDGPEEPGGQAPDESLAEDRVSGVGDLGDAPPTVFHGGGGPAILTIRPPTAPADVNLTIENVTFREAANGLRIDRADRVNLTGVRFAYIGTRWAPYTLATGYYAVLLHGSSHATIADTSFVAIENEVSPGLIHGVYVAHGSSHNRMIRLTMNEVSGDPIRFRDASSWNTVEGSSFLYSGSRAPVSDWYNRTTEAPSWGNTFRGSTYDAGYSGQTLAPRWCFDSPGGMCPPTRFQISLGALGLSIATQLHEPRIARSHERRLPPRLRGEQG